TLGTFSAVATARNALLHRQGWNVKTQGLSGSPPLRIVASEECHPTTVRALGYAGFGSDQIEYVPTDMQGRLDANQLPKLDDRTLVILQAGNINSGASDPFRTVCEAARTAGAWVHVDGAFGLWGRACPSTAPQLSGVQHANSWAVDGHKWLNLPQDNAIYVARDPYAVNEVFGVHATYLNQGSQREPNQLTPELSRRARGIEWYAALATLGRQGVAALLEHSCSQARRFAAELERSGYEVMNEVVLNQVVFRLNSETTTRVALEFIQRSGIAWLGPTRWKDHFALRISVSSAATTDKDVERSLEVLSAAARFAHASKTS
ncbi:MAG: pyridoxal-dependent decarboxylase, partial [Myxococcota bacterium]